MPMIPEERGLICECCTLKLANDDTSSCEEYCVEGHVEGLCQFGLEPGEAACVGDHEGVLGFRCAGCGQDVIAEAHALVVLSPR